LADRTPTPTGRSSDRDLLALLHRGEPAVTVFNPAVCEVEEPRLEREGHLAGLARADHDPVDATDGGHLSRGPGKEKLVRHVERLTRDRLLPDDDSHVPRDGDDRVTGDSLQERTLERGRDEHSVAHQEQVLAAAFAH